MRSLEEWTKYLEQQEQALMDSPAHEHEEEKRKAEPAKGREFTSSAVIDREPVQNVSAPQAPLIREKEIEEVHSVVPPPVPRVEPQKEVEIDLFSAEREDEPKRVKRKPRKTAVKSEEVAQSSYKEFKETREELLHRLLDPEISLEEAARILNVCPTTVRRYTNKGALRHHRTAGNQRRFRLSDVLSFMEKERPSD